MKYPIRIVHLAIVTTLLFCGFANVANSQIWHQYYNLEGHWKFSIGDDPDWKQADFNDSQWDDLNVPASWESQGYDDYNGYAWYRKDITLNKLPQETVYLRIGGIDDADEVYLNGRFVNRSGGFPPAVETAWNRERSYRIPASYWQQGKNVFAIKVYDFYNEGGILRHPVALYVDETNAYLSVNLSGQWHFTTRYHNSRDVFDFNDSKWTTIRVPGYWDTQGWPNFDGVAWYSRTFNCNGRLKDKELFLVLGRIDDQEIVFLNGKKIGDTKDLRRHMSFWNRTEDYRLFRAYPIPEGLLKFDSANNVTVKVNDLRLQGGIYEGPVGIMTRDQLEAYYQLNHSQKDRIDRFWEWLLD